MTSNPDRPTISSSSSSSSSSLLDIPSPPSRSESLTPKHGPLALNAFEALENEGPSPAEGDEPNGHEGREERLRRRNLAKSGIGIDESVASSSGSGSVGSLDVDDDERENEGFKGHRRTSSLGEARRKMREKIRSPLVSTIKLDELRDTLEIGIEKKFAPLSIPPHRRLQTAAVALWALLIPICLIVFLLCLSFPPFWVVLIPYLIWTQFDTAPDYGGRPKEWARRFFFWTYFAQYYPCSIVKEAELTPDRPYLFGYHPHGIIGMGAFATFATEGTNFSEYFPGIKPHLLTLESNFKIPFYRDILMAHGICSVAKKSCANILSQGPGTAIAIVVGGATESLSAHPGTADLTLKRRFGFIKMAIREGADLVPVFSFGENDIYEQLANAKGSWVYKIQKNFQKMFGFTLPLFYGRGLFNYNYGLMPFRHPIVSVVGKPIHVKKDPHPSDEAVQEMQQLYIEELMRIWDRYKDLYARGRTKELTLVE
ncbi:2-acylglycerol O-acyltransferase 2 [Kwoniella mangroviensis CBS 10435]|uniref:Diacylglycerol O-acyltransferase n=1 Tax=Kwoniella mangroviensis CBS 10435 TaxID=1331196 RepID=A0A1B9ILF0_9TREE|nr:2-acylglycerol O-acyltransferase 2 [Kwoniella mangroviensis CBS 8507]OCF56333.1 2-acylglycerol O-acyltransferase 2 [Kwoniella mangroviensis CBS 10435]OCF62918.1 2-acylglycerol O-acyltransferase 2 [Kwoniella mangroviensis CBS 8507]